MFETKSERTAIIGLGAILTIFGAIAFVAGLVTMIKFAIATIIGAAISEGLWQWKEKGEK